MLSHNFYKINLLNQRPGSFHSPNVPFAQVNHLAKAIGFEGVLQLWAYARNCKTPFLTAALAAKNREWAYSPKF
jgi:hypothetical protein